MCDGLGEAIERVAVAAETVRERSGLEWDYAGGPPELSPLGAQAAAMIETMVAEVSDDQSNDFYEGFMACMGALVELFELGAATLVELEYVDRLLPFYAGTVEGMGHTAYQHGFLLGEGGPDEK